MFNFYEIIDFITHEDESKPVTKITYYALRKFPSPYVAQYCNRATPPCSSIDELFELLTSWLGDKQIALARHSYRHNYRIVLLNLSKRRSLNKEEIEKLEAKIQVASLILETEH